MAVLLPLALLSALFSDQNVGRILVGVGGEHGGGDEARGV
jgi:hypothetical protein